MHFRLFTDFWNLIFLFDPAFQESDCKNQIVAKLCHLVNKFQGFKCTIEHILETKLLLCTLLFQNYRSRFSIAFIDWSKPMSRLELKSSNAVFLLVYKLWIPDAKSLRLRICIEENIGIAVHSSISGTKRRISEFFSLVIVRRRCEVFVSKLPTILSRVQPFHFSTFGRSSAWIRVTWSSPSRLSAHSEEARVRFSPILKHFCAEKR